LKARASYGYSVGVLTALLAGLSVPAVSLILGDQWGGLTPHLITILSIGMLFQTVSYVFYWGLVARARPRLFMTIESPVLVALIFAVIVTAPVGPEAMAWTYSVGIAVRAVLLVIWACPALGVSRRRYVAAAASNIVVLGAVCAGGLLIASSMSDLPAVLTVLCGLVWAGIALLLAAWLSPVVRSDLGQAIGVASQVVGTRRSSARPEDSNGRRA
jgi:hypothetical protein